MKIENPFLHGVQKKLTRKLGLDTLEGGTEGSVQPGRRPILVSSAAELASDVATLATCLDALLDMWHAKNEQERAELDSAYETLVTCLEEWRDAVPKA